MRAHLARCSFLVLLALVWVVLVASTMSATAGLFESTRTAARAGHLRTGAPSAQADGGGAVAGRAD